MKKVENTILAESSPEASLRTDIVEVALIGNPNTGKTSVFNALTGLRQKVGNYPGVTVEKKTGIIIAPDATKIHIHDLPGLYSLIPKSLDDKITVDVLSDASTNTNRLKLVVMVADASNLERNLYLLSQVLDLGLPVILALNMVDIARARGLEIDVEKLSQALGIPVIPVMGKKRLGIPQLRQKIFDHAQHAIPPAPAALEIDEEITAEITPLIDWFLTCYGLSFYAARAQALRALANGSISSKNATFNSQPLNGNYIELQQLIEETRERLSQKNISWEMIESNIRYNWVDKICRNAICKENDKEVSLSEKMDRVLTHRVAGPAIFMFVFAVIFQSIFSWAEVPMEAIENGISWVGAQIARIMPDGILQSLIVDGAIAGVGAILVFLPQILFLFFFLALLEDSGYMARVAFILDRFMKGIGLSGRSVIPLMSSFACAIPGIMATRTIQDWRERLVTIMIAPFMSCSARLPVYILMIGAFIPDVSILGVFSLAGITLLSMYLLGIFAAVGVGLVFKSFLRKRIPAAPFVMELPTYRIPAFRGIFLQMIERAKIFVTDAGKIILAISIVLWFLASFPKPAENDTVRSSEQIRQSYVGQIGQLIEPVIEPLGFDWKLGIGLITSFAAREVLVSTLATIYNVEGGDETSVSLREALQNEKDPVTGKPIYTPLVAISLMVFFVLACQCMATVAVVKRETNSWRWPILMVIYMTAMAYVCSFIVYQGGLFLGLG